LKRKVQRRQIDVKLFVQTFFCPFHCCRLSRKLFPSVYARSSNSIPFFGIRSCDFGSLPCLGQLLISLFAFCLLIQFARRWHGEWTREPIHYQLIGAVKARTIFSRHVCLAVSPRQAAIGELPEQCPVPRSQLPSRLCGQSVLAL